MLETVVEASIRDLRAALERGEATSTGLVAAHLARIAHDDRAGARLHALSSLASVAFAEAAAADRRRAAGECLGPLDGIPYTAKASYLVRGMPATAGSPAFAELVAQRDAFAIERLRAAGAICLGLTTMPPMADGGMQRGLDGRAESPYSAEWMPAAYGSGSSNGSGAATAASFGAFGLAEETWSSGRSPASNNGLVAYTPSRGLISVRGNWPLVPTMDVVVPHTRSVADLVELLDVLVVDDAETRGDLWRTQPWVPIGAPSGRRPASFADALAPAALAGVRLGVPRIFLGRDREYEAARAAGFEPGTGFSTGQPIEPHPDVLERWDATKALLEALGAEVVEVDFPALSNAERDRPGAATMADRGLVPPDFEATELGVLSAWAWNDFLEQNGDQRLHRLADVDARAIYPLPPGTLPDPGRDYEHDLVDLVALAAEGLPQLDEIEGLAWGLRGLERTRELDVEEWLDAAGLDALVFPSAADVAAADADVNPASFVHAWRNGVWVSTGNLVPRHLGLPTVSLTMGTMRSKGMPVGVTFLGGSDDDAALIGYAAALEAAGAGRPVPPRTPEIEAERMLLGAGRPDAGWTAGASSPIELTLRASIERTGDELVIRVFGVSDAERIVVTIAGEPVEVRGNGETFAAERSIPAREHEQPHSPWLPPHGSLVVVVAGDARGQAGGWIEVR